MKKIMFVFVALMIMSVSVTAQENWSSYTSEMGKFSIDFYGDVLVSDRETDDSMTYKTTFTSGSMTFMANSSSHSNSLEGNDNLLNISVDTFVKGVSGSLVSREDIIDNGVKGIFAVMTLQEGTILLEYKVFINGNYQYQVIVYAEKEKYIQSNANQFFDSFKIFD